jgi:hypothetical protein
MLVVGCGGKPTPEPERTTYERELPSDRDLARPTGPSDMPAWFIDTPEEDDVYIYGTGMGESGKPNIALEKAKAAATNEISTRIEAEVKSLTQNFMQEAGMGESTQIVEFYKQGTEIVTNNRLNGLTPLEKVPVMRPDNSWVAYVLMGLKKDAVATEVVNLIKNEEALYSEFKASQTFQELESKLGGGE